MKTDTPRTNRFYASFADGECIPNQDEWLALCESLESELTAARAEIERLRDHCRTKVKALINQTSARIQAEQQRDRLAEALKNIGSGIYAWHTCVDKLAPEALQSLTTNEQ